LHSDSIFDDLKLVGIDDELYNFMVRNIIVQTRKVKPNDERSDLSKKDELVKPSTPKNAISFSFENHF
jgi:hypothetical protein